jgi:quercetin dioxygenase-like cupin family protein
MSNARATEHIDDDRSRVTQWTFTSAGDATGPHVHEFDYIVVPVTGGELTVVASDGTERSMMQVAGTPYRGQAGTRHNVVAVGDMPIVFVEVELKTQPTRADT